MGRGKKTQRPATRRPERVLVIPTAGGRAMSGTGVGCGRPDPRIAGAAHAEAVATDTVTALARDVHGRAVEIGREALPEGAWAGRVREGVAR